MIGIVNTGASNLGVFAHILLSQGYKFKVISKPSDFREIEKLIIPGVGSFDRGIGFLKSAGVYDLVANWLMADRPTFCVCLGFQLLFDASEEGELQGFGLIKGSLKRFVGTRVPRIGWGYVDWLIHQNRLDDFERFYFVHSYFAPPCDEAICLANFGVDYTCGIRLGNIVGYQFHPEKSHSYGLNLICEFLRS